VTVAFLRRVQIFLLTYLLTRHITGHFGDEPFQVIDYTDSDGLKTRKQNNMCTWNAK